MAEGNEPGRRGAAPAAAWPMRRPAPGRPLRILALSGGGFLGLYSAAVMAALEAEIGEPIGRRFDLIAGTSVGGVIAAAAACELPMRRIVDLFAEQGPKVFSPRSLPGGALSRLVDMGRSVLGPKYSGQALRDALAERLGERTLGDALHPLVLPAVNVTRSLTKVFKTPHVAASQGDERVRIVDAAMATCAAPAYFPSVAIGGALYADGGLYAVAPDQVALHEAEHFIGADIGQVRMLSIGTATRGYRPEGGADAKAGAVGWLAAGRLILSLIAVQQQHVEAMMEDRLGDRYLRLDADWPAGAGLGIDVATREAAEVLAGLAARTVAEADRARWSLLF